MIGNDKGQNETVLDVIFRALAKKNTVPCGIINDSHHWGR